MSRVRSFTLCTLLAITLTIVVACGAAPVATAPTDAPIPTTATVAPDAPTTMPTEAPTTPPASSVPTLSSEEALLATIAAQPTDAPTAVVPTTTPLADTNPNTPNDTTQARLRVTPCVFGGPPVDVLVNGTVVVNGGMPFSNIAPFYSTGYVYLAPGTYSVAVVPTGQQSAPALLDPVEVSVAAGHRYTLAVLGQAADAQHPSLLIDETVAYQRAGAAPDRRGRITINNLKGAPGITFAMNGVAGNDAPYGGFAASTWPAENLESFAFTVSGAPDQVIDRGGPLVMGDFFAPSIDTLDCWGVPIREAMEPRAAR